MASAYDPIFDAAGAEWNVDPNLLRAMTAQESRGQSNAVSLKGAQGLMQLMPDTARAMGVADLNDPVQNIFGGAKYMSQALTAERTPEDALRYYHGGPGWRGAYGPESQGYAPGVTANYQRIVGQQQPAVVPVAAPAQRQSASADGWSYDPTAGRWSQASAQQPPASAAVPVADVIPMAAPAAASGASPMAAPAPAASADYSDFLRRTGAGVPGAGQPAAAPPATDYSDFLKRTGASVVAPDPVVPRDPMAAFPAAILDTPPPVSADAGAGIQRVLSATGKAAGDAFGPSGLGLSPEQRIGLQRAGIVPTGPGGNFASHITGAAVDTAAPFVDLAGRGIRALVAGGQAGVMQAGEEVGQPGLARAIASAPEAFPFGFNRGVPSTPPGMVPVNRLAGAARIGEGGPLPTAALMDMADGGIPANRLVGPASAVPDGVPNRLTGTPGVPVTAGSSPGNQLAAPAATGEWRPMRDGEALAPGQEVATGANGQQFVRNAPAPNSVGAAATPSNLSGLTPAQELAYRSTAEGTKLLERQPTGRDLTSYVPGVDPTLAQTEQSVNMSRELKALNVASLEVSQAGKDLAAEHNTARYNFADAQAGSPVDVMNAKDARNTQGAANRAAAWQDKTAADAQPMLDTEKSILDSADGRRPVVRNAVASVTKELYGPDGKLLTDPEMLYGVRKHIDDLLSNEAKSDSQVSQRATAQLLELKGVLDGVIEKAAPGFGKYLSDYAAASRPIDAMEALQGVIPKMFDAQNQMQYSRVQSVMKQIVDRRASDGINPFKSISDETMGNLFALRDDLRRVATEKDLAKAPGSDSPQTFLDLAKLGGTTALHGAANMVAPVIGSAALGAVKNAFGSIMDARAARQQTARGMNLLNPDRTANPLQNRLTDP